MSRPALIATMTYAEYMALEERSGGQRHEYLRGEVYAMSGGTPEHAALEAAMAGELRNALEAAGKQCRVYSANLRLRVEATDFTCYADASVVCGKAETSPADRHAVTNPTVLVEVPSDSTESYDRGIKAGHYRHMPSIREYVLVSQHCAVVEVWRKNEQERWEVATVAGKGEKAALASLDISIDVDAVCRESAVAS